MGTLAPWAGTLGVVAGLFVTALALYELPRRVRVQGALCAVGGMILMVGMML